MADSSAGDADERDVTLSGQLYGTVTNVNGVGTPDATITVVNADTGETTATTTTDSNGDYSVTVADGTYALTAVKRAPDGAYLRHPVEKTASVSGTSTEVNFTLVRPDYKLRGAFSDRTGRAIHGINRADTGVPVGVRGLVPSATDGYGLATPNDVRVGGAIESVFTHVVTIQGDRVAKLGRQRSDDGFQAAGKVIFGYEGNTVQGIGTTIGGGGKDSNRNRVLDDYGTVSGGYGNEVKETEATIAGGHDNLAEGTESVVSGGRQNTAKGPKSTISGGNRNEAGHSSVVGGGSINKAFGEEAVIGGGASNATSGFNPTIAGGNSNEASDSYAAVVGGRENVAAGEHSSVGGGANNHAHSQYAGIGSGRTNRTGVTGSDKLLYATVPGGRRNVADGKYSLAAGRRAKTDGKRGSFVWGDSTTTSVRPSAKDEVVLQAGGTRSSGVAVEVYSQSDGSAGVVLDANAGSWGSLSSRAAKTDVRPVDSQRVLDTLEDVTVSTWRYEGQSDDVRHMGPMAGPFNEAFGLGTARDRITNVDADGVAMAAIKGLSESLDARDERIDRLEKTVETLGAENERLRERNDSLEDRVSALEAQQGRDR